MRFNSLNTKTVAIRIAFALLFIFGSNYASASNENNEENDFNAGEMIMHHILDAHEIHLFTLNEGTPEEHHINIPLPIILYTDDRGVEVFSSSKFHNADHSYDRYIMHHEKIYIADADGQLVFDEKEHAINEKPIDLSITKTVTGILITVILMFFLFGGMAKSYKKRRGQAPKGVQSFLEPLVLFVRDEIAKPSIGHKYERYMPFLLSVFFFIWIANLLGLIPFIGGFNVTGNISITLVLATFTFVITTFTSNKNYWIHIFNTPGVPWWLKLPVPLMPVIELFGMFIKPVVLTLRLFANITAGHIIILSFVSLIFIFGNLFGDGAGYGVSIVSIAFSIFMNFLELLVAFLQAYVFTLLSALYFGAAVEEHH
ncbi:MAG: ATP synthase F0 subunit A [Verrucomicrobia bacterium]|nr:ATP synthase F0 subunit A [Verrucomicrobiota bacterium]